LSSRLITGATPLFALGMTLDFYLLVRAVSENRALALAMGIVIIAITVLLWYGVPHVKPLAPPCDSWRIRPAAAGRTRRSTCGLFGLALLAPGLVRCRGGDALRELVGATAG